MKILLLACSLTSAVFVSSPALSAAPTSLPAQGATLTWRIGGANLTQKGDLAINIDSVEEEDGVDPAFPAMRLIAVLSQDQNVLGFMSVNTLVARLDSMDPQNIRKLCAKYCEWANLSSEPEVVSNDTWTSNSGTEYKVTAARKIRRVIRSNDDVETYVFCEIALKSLKGSKVFLIPCAEAVAFALDSIPELLKLHERLPEKDGVNDIDKAPLERAENIGDNPGRSKHYFRPPTEGFAGTWEVVDRRTRLIVSEKWYGVHVGDDPDDKSIFLRSKQVGPVTRDVYPKLMSAFAKFFQWRTIAAAERPATFRKNITSFNVDVENADMGKGPINGNHEVKIDFGWDNENRSSFLIIGLDGVSEAVFPSSDVVWLERAFAKTPEAEERLAERLTEHVRAGNEQRKKVDELFK